MKPILQLITITILSITALVFSICLLCFLIQTLHAAGKGNITILGQIGDFIGGILGTILTFAGVVITWLVAMAVNRLQKQLANQSHTNQIENTKIQIRHLELTHFKSEIDRAYRSIESTNSQEKEIGLKNMQEAINRVSTIFPEIETPNESFANFKSAITEAKFFFLDPSKSNLAVENSRYHYRSVITTLGSWLFTGEIKYETLNIFQKETLSNTHIHKF